MKEPIEQFIMLHRSSFDTLEPESTSWNLIQRRLKKPEKLSNILLKIAAVIAVAMVLGVMVYSNSETTHEPVMAANQEFLQEEIAYVKVIQTQKKELKLLDIESKNQDLLVEEAVLEEIYLSLKTQYLENPTDDRLRESLLQNLRLRGLILMEQIELLKSVNSKSDDQEISNS